MATISMALSDLRPGQTGRIREYMGVHEMHYRLMELGLLPGTSIRCMRVAPLGDPVEVEVRGCYLSLRKSEAATIAVDPV